MRSIEHKKIFKSQILISEHQKIFYLVTIIGLHLILAAVFKMFFFNASVSSLNSTALSSTTTTTTTVSSAVQNLTKSAADALQNAAQGKQPA